MKSNPNVLEFFKRFDLQFLNYSNMSGKLRLIPKLKDGQKVIGKLEKYDSDSAILELQDESRVQVGMFSVLEQALDAGDYEDEIIEISRDGNEYEIYQHEDWPEDEKPKK